MAGCWRAKNTASLGSLWLQLLHFLAVLFTSTDLVVSLRQRSPLSRVDKAWGNKKISIEGGCRLSISVKQGWCPAPSCWLPLIQCLFKRGP